MIKQSNYERSIFFIVVHHSCSKEKRTAKLAWCIMIMQLQNEVISIQKQPSCEKSVQPQNARVERNQIKGGGQEMAVTIRSSI